MICDYLREHLEQAIKILARPVKVKKVLRVESRILSAHKEWIVNETPKFYLKLAGKLNIKYPGGDINLNNKEVALFAPHIPHKEKRIGNKFKNSDLVINFRNNKIQLIVAGKKEYCLKNNIIDRCHLSNKYRPATLELMNILTSTEADLPKAVERETLHNFLCLIRQAYINRDSAKPHYSPLVECALDIINEQISNSSFNVQDLSRRVGCSSEHLSRIFSKETGKGINSYINELRISLSESILRSQSYLRISEVAYMSGFSSSGYFCTSFKKARKITAEQFRKNLA
jgi:AraC-like DNA-binding protein